MNLHAPDYRRVIRHEFTQEAFERFIYFERSYLNVGGVAPGTDPGINYAITFADDHHSVAITYRDDAVAGLTWVQVTFLLADHPAAQATFDHAVQRIQERVPTYTRDELMAFARSASVSDRVFTVFATAIGAPWTFDAAAHQDLQAAATDPSPEVRAAAVTATGYLGQTEYLPLLDDLASDEDAAVRERATDMQARFASALQASL